MEKIIKNKVVIFIVFLLSAILVSVNYSKLNTPIDEVKVIINEMASADKATYAMMLKMLDIAKSTNVQAAIHVIGAVMSLLFWEVVCAITLKIDERKLQKEDKTGMSEIMSILFVTLYFSAIKNFIGFVYQTLTNKLLFYNTVCYAIVTGLITLITSVYIIKAIHNKVLADGSSRKTTVTNSFLIILPILYFIILIL